MNRFERWVPWLLASLLLFSVAGTAGAIEEEKRDTASESETPSESEKLLERFESLREKRLERRIEIAALEADAQTRTGEDRAALNRYALELTLEAAGTIEEMSAQIEQMNALESKPSTQAQEQMLRDLLPPVQQSILDEYSRQSSKSRKLAEEQAGLTEPDALAAIQPVLRRQKDLRIRILSAGVRLSAVAESVGLDTRAQREWLKEQLGSEARLFMSQRSLMKERAQDASELEAAGADPAAAAAAIAAATLRQEAVLESLASTVDLLEQLEVDVSDYRRVLIESTGEVTIDAFDREVVADLSDRLTSNIRERVSENGAQFAFQAVLVAFIALFFWGLSRFVRKVVSRLVEAPHLRFTQLLKRMIVSLSTTIVLIIGFLVALSQLGIEIAPMLAGLGIAGFVLGFALQDTLGNFAAGVMVLIYRPYDVGDMIDCAGGVFGQVSHMSLVSTTILTIDNKTLIVPNSKIWGDVITNVTAQAIRRIDLEFGIGYGDDIPQAEEVLRSVIEDHPKILEDPEPVIKVHSLGDSSVNFVVRPWVARDDYWDVHWDITREVKLRFDREGVSIPFPQRDVHFYPAEPAGPKAISSESMEIGSSPLSATDEPQDDADEA